jgi:hypothetical protein
MKVGIHLFGYDFRFKTFVFHHMTPMTGSIANANQQELVFFLKFYKICLFPGLPMDWVIGVLF